MTTSEFLGAINELANFCLPFRRFKVLVEATSPRATLCFYGQRLKSMHVSFIDTLRGQNERIKMSLSYVGVRKEVANCCLPFKGFKGVTRYTLCI